jgi:hypothetical protein
VEQLYSDLLDHGMSMSEISKLLGERGPNAAYELERFANGKSEHFTKDEGCERLELALAQIAQWRKESASPVRDSSPGGAARSADASTARVSTELSVPSSGRNSLELTVSSGMSSQQAYHRCSGEHETNHGAAGPSGSSSSAARRE